MRTLPFRSVLALTIALVTSLSLTPVTQAAGESITIAQMSRTDTVGVWTLHMPGGKRISSGDVNTDAHMYTVKNPALGSYTLVYEPPRGARTTVEFFRGTDKISSSSNLSTTFTLVAGETLRLVAEYSFDGSIRVQSNPSGAEFVVTGPNDIVLKGTTPAQFADLPPYTYTAHFESRAGCGLVKPQKRELETPGTLIFYGNYVCTSAQPKPVVPATPPVAKDPVIRTRMRTVRRLDMDHVISQREVLAGGELLITLRVHNPSSKVIRDIEIMETFDPSQLSFRGDLARDPKKAFGKLTWSLSDLQPDETWSVTITGHVSSSLVSGTQINLSATSRSTDLVRPAGEIASVAVITNGNLPETGGAFDLLFLVVSSALALVTTRKMRRS